jgi:uncharacterized protein GlcG (DUF336 family)
MPSFPAACAGTVVVAALALPAQAQLLTHRDLSYPIARTIAEAAIESCGAKTYQVSAVVVDRAGEVIVAMRADGAGPHTMENAPLRPTPRSASARRPPRTRSAMPKTTRWCTSR